MDGYNNGTNRIVNNNNINNNNNNNNNSINKGNENAKNSINEYTNTQQPYRQFVTTLLDSSTNKLVQITSQPPPDYVAIKKRRNRISISCMGCKRRKVKCDRVRPICGSCQKHGYSICVYAADENENNSSSNNSDNNNNNNNSTIINKKKNNISDNILLSFDSKNNYNYYNHNNHNEELEEEQFHKNNKSQDEFNNLLLKLEKLKLTHIQNDEIDQLRNKIENLRFYLDDNNILNCKILKNLKLINSIILKPILKTTPNISMDSFDLQFGASSITNYKEVDKFMGTIFEKSLPKIKNDLSKWKSIYSVEIFSESLEKLIIKKNFNINSNLNLNDLKLSKFKLICKLLENYFINFETFMKIMGKSIKILIKAVPIVPENLINKLLKDHFINSNNNSNNLNNLKIIKINSIDDASEILLILAILRFGLPKSENVIKIPKNINFETLLDNENINTDYKTDLLNSFLKLILNETDLSKKFNIPMLGTLVILFMISYTHRFNFKSTEKDLGLNYGIMAIYMAISLGVYSKLKPINNNSDNNNNNNNNNNIINIVNYNNNKYIPTNNLDQINYLNYFKNSDLNNTWNLVMFIDTFSSFNSGIPQLINSNMDHIYVTSFVDKNCANICSFYRKSFLLATSNNNNNNNNNEVSIIDYERFIIEFEKFITNDLIPTSICINNNDLVGAANSIRAVNLLLFLYYNGYFTFIKTFEEFKLNNDYNSNLEIINEFNELNKRLFNRSIKLSIVSLIDLNIMLVSEKDGTFYEKYSFDLIQIFIRIIYTLTSFMCRLIVENKLSNINDDNNNDDNNDFNFLFDITREQSEELCKYFVSIQCSLSTKQFDDDIIKLNESINLLSKNPHAMIKLLVRFFFNTSRSLISQNFIYYTLYKYFVMTVKHLLDIGGDINAFDIEIFEKEYSYVDCTWFINK